MPSFRFSHTKDVCIEVAAIYLPFKVNYWPQTGVFLCPNTVSIFTDFMHCNVEDESNACACKKFVLGKSQTWEVKYHLLAYCCPNRLTKPDCLWLLSNYFPYFSRLYSVLENTSTCSAFENKSPIKRGYWLSLYLSH